MCWTELRDYLNKLEKEFDKDISKRESFYEYTNRYFRENFKHEKYDFGNKEDK